MEQKFSSKAFIKSIMSIVDVCGINYECGYLTWYDGEITRDMLPEKKYQTADFDDVMWIQMNNQGRPKLK